VKLTVPRLVGRFPAFVWTEIGLLWLQLVLGHVARWG